MCDKTDADTWHDDMEVLQHRLVENILERDVEPEEVRCLADSLSGDGTWEDVDYDHQRRSGWKTFSHLNRIQSMTIAWRKPTSPLHKDERMLDSILAGLDHWLEHDYSNPNWWWNQIGVPRVLGNIILLLKPRLSEEQLRGGLKILERAEVGMTGQNLVWLTLITAVRGLLMGDAQLVSESFERIQAEIRVTEDEGIQPDYSFQQHGPCLYNHGYGAGFARDCSRLAVMVRGTAFAFDPEKVAILTRFTLDGSRWMTRRQWADPGANGRGITRQGLKSCEYLVQVAENMLKLPTGRSDDFEALKSRVESGKPPLTGHRHFWRSDFMTHHRPSFYVSARMYSERVDNTDWPCNDEGLKNHHIADGTTFIVRRGDEYRGIMPVWDWQKIPGTAVVQKPELSGDPRRSGETSFVGGLSDGEYGLAAFDFHNSEENLRARKSWFCCDRFVVCLGAGISTSRERPVITTLNQCRLNGGVTVCAGGNRVRLNEGEHRLEEVSSVFHDGIGYVFPRPATVNVENGERSGNWWRVNHQYSNEDVTRDVCTLWLDHGVSPDDAGYSYVIVPRLDEAGIAACVSDPSVEILRNSPGVHAVSHRGLDMTQAAFYEAGALECPGMPCISTEEPCLILVRGTDYGLTVSVADPTQSLDEIGLRLAGSFETEEEVVMRREGRTHVNINLPGGPEAGSTRTIELKRRQ
jgi:chondroitin AC lyase